MNKVKLLDDIAEKCDIHFYDFETENDVIIAKSHFLKFELYDDKIVISDKTMLPGHLMKPIIDQYLPITMRYAENKFESILFELVEEVSDKLFYAEYVEEHGDE
jgi:hypothetical protein